jgi:hypothetical protein
LEARDEQLIAFVEQLLEDLHPLRNDLEEVERTRDQQHWNLVHGMQQQTAAIRPLHGEISNFQSAADQNFHTVFTKLDDHTAAVDMANKMLNSIGDVLFGGLGRLSARMIPGSATVSSLEQSLDDSCYALPQVEDEDGWLMFQECGSRPPGNSEPVEDEDKPKGATKIDKLLTGAVPAVDIEPKSDIHLLGETEPAQEAVVQRSIESPANAKLKKDLQPISNIQHPRTRKPRKTPAQELVVTQQTERLEAIYSKIIALEKRIGEEDKLTVQRSDYLKLEKAAAVIVRAYEAVVPLENSATSSSRR